MSHDEINACYTFLTAVADAIDEHEPVTVAQAEHLLLTEFRCDPIMVWGIVTTWQATRYGVVLPATTNYFRYTAPARVPFGVELPNEKIAPTMNFSVYNLNELR